MAKLDLKNTNCAPGPLFVDTTCIDCETCFHIAPEIFKEDQRSKSFVMRQPESIAGWSRAKEAILSCPTSSIGVDHPPADFKNAPDTLPRLINDDVYYCGYTAESSYGATSYLIIHPEGNILVDSPRFNKHLVKKIEELGGLRYMFLSHRDDVADHKKFADHFLCERIIHALDVVSDTRDCEIVIEGENDFQFGKDFKIIPTPGHTPGHTVLLYKEKFLFTGDHLFYNHDTGKLYASKNVNWYSWDIQLKSLGKLLNYPFEWIMPGHGGWVKKKPGEIKEELSSYLNSKTL